MTRSTQMQRPRVLSLVVALVTMGLGAAGCGSSDDAANPADDFVGTWRYDTVQSVQQCPSPMDATDEPPEVNKTFVHGASAALVDLSPSPLFGGVSCDFAFDVSGTTATAQPGQTCLALSALDGYTIDQPDGQAPLWTFTLNSATTASEQVSATVHYSISGAITTCSWTLQARLTRLSKD